jgi:hypothetical protein
MNRLLSRTIACAGVTILSSLTATAAGAQAGLPARTDVAGARPQPEFEPIQVRLGAWFAAPELRLNQGYDSNPFGVASAAQGDAFLIVTPGLRLSSDWGLHGIDLSARLVATRYADHGQQNSDEYGLSARGRLDLPAQTTATFSATFDRNAERRSPNGAPLVIGEPTLVHAQAQAIDLRREGGRIVLEIKARRASRSYSDLVQSDGQVISQRFRNVRTLSVEAAAGTLLSSAMAVGLAAHFERSHAPLVPNRDSDAVTLKGTMGVDLGLFRLETEAGYLSHRFPNPAFKDYRGFVYRGSLSWYPTPLLSLTARASRSLEGSGDPAAGALVANGIGLRADYELLRNFMLKAEFGQRKQRLRETARAIVSRSAELKGEYSFNRSVAIGAYAQHECRDSAGTVRARDYCASMIGVTLSIRR